MSWLWDHSPATAHVELLIELALADFADDDGRCWPSVATIAWKARCSERHVQRTIRGLIEAGRLEVEYGAGPHGVSVYTFKLSGVTQRHPFDDLGVTTGTEGVTPATPRGDILVSEMSPDPSITINDPSKEPSLAERVINYGEERAPPPGYKPETVADVLAKRRIAAAAVRRRK